MIKQRMENNRGFVLLVALGVLGVLGLLAATFATLSRVERVVSNSYVDKVRAKMLAQSGVERAIASIRGRALVQSWDDQRNDWYYREMLNAEAGTAISYPGTVKSDVWKFNPTRAYGMPPRSLELAFEDGMTGGTNGISFPQPQSPTVNEAFSGEFPGTYMPKGDVYALKVLDCASMINVNDGGEQTQRMLNNLGDILKNADATPFNGGGFKLGDKIKAKATARGKAFNNKSEILDEVFIQDPLFAGNPTEAKKRFDAVKDFITCHGWIDGMTQRFMNTWTGATDYVGGSYASATSSLSNDNGSTMASVDHGTGAATAAEEAEGHALKAVDEATAFATSPLYSFSPSLPGAYASLPSTGLLAAPPATGITDIQAGGGFKQYILGSGVDNKTGKFGGTYYKTEPRCPININTATREVLVAQLMDLEASFWDYTVVSEGASKKEYNARLGIITSKITKVQAEAVADFLIGGRFTHGSPAGSWSYNDWMHFEDDAINKIPGLDRFQKGLIKANGNPNSNIKKLCPDLILVQSDPSVEPDEIVRLDKSDILKPSTEWTFSSNGFFEIESIGRVYNGTQTVSEEKIETVVKVWDQVRYTTQEQLEKDRSFTADSSDEGDLLAGGYPPVVSMPEYVYNAASNPIHYRSQTGDVSWAADYEGYLVLNGPAKVQAGISPGPAPDGDSMGTASKACWGPNPSKYKGSPLPGAAIGNKCGVSFVAGFNNASLYVNQSHRKAWHDGPSGFMVSGGGPRHPEYAYSSPHCFADGMSMSANPPHSDPRDVGFGSGYTSPVFKPYQIEPTAAASGWSWGGAAGGTGANFWDNGCDLQNFGVYINWLRRERFHTYWADEVPAPDCTIEMTVKPEMDLWTWATNSKMHTSSGMWGGGYKIWPCKRQFLYDWGVGGTAGMNYTVRCYVELFRVYLEMFHHATNQFYVMYADHQWKPHTWHHVETSWTGSYNITLADGSTVTVPPNAMLFVDGQSAGSGGSDDHILSSKYGAGTRDVSQVVLGAYPAQAMRLEFNVNPTWPNNNVGSGPRMDIGSTLANDGIFGMSSPRWIGVIDNIVMHHWRSHTATFTPRNRYHSSTYYDGASFSSGKGYSGEKAGVYKKRLTFLEAEAKVKNVTIGTVGCTHYHPFHVHLYGHDGTAPTTAFGHITPAIRLKGSSTKDFYYYDGCVGVPVKEKVNPTDEVYYLGWFEVASLVPVTMSPILCDINITYFSEPVTFYRLSSSEAKK